MIPDYSKKSRERQSENDKLRKTVGSENENEVIHEATSCPGLFHRNLRKSPENQVGHEVLFSDLFYTVNVWHKRFELMNHKE